MFSKTTSDIINREHVLHEYEQHVREGRTAMVASLRESNPDLLKHFETIDANTTATV
jgi:hypothetical protein